MPPYPLPQEKTKSVIKTNSSKGAGGTNEIRFEDRKDAEQILVYAQKDLHVRANQDQVETTGRDRHMIVTQNHFEQIKQSRHSEVTLDVRERVGGSRSLEVKGDLAEEVKGKHSQQVGSDLYINAGGKIVIEAAEITLNAGGNFVKIDSGGVHNIGKQVKLNCAGTTAGIGSAAALQAPEAPVEADTADPGHDVTYGQERRELEALDVEGMQPPSEEQEQEQETSWIEIEMVDEMGQPWPHERYELVTPNGKLKRGNLDENGQAHVNVATPGVCHIRFPKLDAQAWERI
jgi:hypothetical protein